MTRPALMAATGPLPHPAVVATAMAVGLPAGLPYLGELVTVRTVPASAFSILLSLEPAAGALMGLAILGQHPGPGSRWQS